MVNYYLKMEPHLFKEAVQTQFQRIQQEREAARAAAQEKEQQAKAAASDKSELVLYRCPPPWPASLPYSCMLSAACAMVPCACMHA
jgi:hypothetical protein